MIISRHLVVTNFTMTSLIVLYRTLYYRVKTYLSQTFNISWCFHSITTLRCRRVRNIKVYVIVKSLTLFVRGSTLSHGFPTYPPVLVLLSGKPGDSSPLRPSLAHRVTSRLCRIRSGHPRGLGTNRQYPEDAVHLYPVEGRGDTSQ